jgi:hypothetical protein
MQLEDQGQDAVPKGGQGGDALGVNDEQAGVQLAGNQLHQQGQAEEAPPRLAEGNQAQDGPVMPSDMFAPVGIAAVVFPNWTPGILPPFLATSRVSTTAR